MTLGKSFFSEAPQSSWGQLSQRKGTQEGLLTFKAGSAHGILLSTWIIIIFLFCYFVLCDLFGGVVRTAEM